MPYHLYITDLYVSLKAPIEPTEETVEPPPRPPSPEEAEPKEEVEAETKTPRMASLRLKMRDRLQKAKVLKLTG